MRSGLRSCIGRSDYAGEVDDAGRPADTRLMVNRWARLCSLVLLAMPASAWADGNETQALSFSDEGAGLGLISTGIGLAGRREVGADLPTTSKDLVLAGIPAGATIEKAFLYWITMASPTASVILKGTAVTGQLIGTSAPTCWSETWAPVATTPTAPT